MTYIPGGGGGSGSLSMSSDVALNNVANKEVLAYNTSTAKWTNTTVDGLLGATLRTVSVKRLSANHTLGETDINAYIRVENISGEVVITVPHSSAWNPPVGTTVTIRRRGDGTVRISAADTSSVYLFPNPSIGTFTITETHATVTLVKFDTDGWDIEGMFA